VSLTAELLEELGHEIESFNLIPSSGGRFEVTVDGELIYSKLATGRHAEPGEIRRLLEAKTGQ
jgi:selenoprotein W-related protein